MHLTAVAKLDSNRSHYDSNKSQLSGNPRKKPVNLQEMTPIRVVVNLIRVIAFY